MITPQPPYPYASAPRERLMALTICQPWATAIACGVKRIDTRSWQTSHRGPLAIHAGLAYSPALLGDILDLVPELPPGPYPRGVVVAVCTLAAVAPMPEAPDDLERRLGWFGPRRYGWSLEDVRALPRPVTARGSLGLWRVAEDAVRAIWEQIGGRP